MASYSTDEDLVRVRSDALSLGVDDLAELHEEAHDRINDMLEAVWYKTQARDHGLDPDLTAMDESRIDVARLKTLACLKVLELLYKKVMKSTTEPDGYDRLRRIFRTEFEDEFNLLMERGLGYDWSLGGSIDPDERFTTRIRRTRRC